MSAAVQCAHGAQINFEDLTPDLTYDSHTEKIHGNETASRVLFIFKVEHLKKSQNPEFLNLDILNTITGILLRTKSALQWYFQILFYCACQA
jgi:hypothetical protein